MLQILADGPLPTDFGDFHLYLFKYPGKFHEHVAMTFGEVEKERDCVIRVHSACVTGEIFRANNCDCRQQLDDALRFIVEYGRGALLYLDQEGRGNGLEAKLKTFDLIVNQGIDPHNAFKQMGYPADLREYSVAAEMLSLLRINYPVKILTNNPQKVYDLKKAGVKILERIDSLVLPKNEMMRKNFLSKRDELGHSLPKDLGGESK